MKYRIYHEGDLSVGIPGESAYIELDDYTAELIEHEIEAREDFEAKIKEAFWGLFDFEPYVEIYDEER